MLEHKGATSLIRMNDVWKSFGAHEVLRGVDLEVRAGDVLCLIGPSGCGKSTALRSINALEPIDRGSIEVCGMDYRTAKESLHRIRQQTAMVFQRFELFPHLTVLENVALAPRLTKGLTRHEADLRARELLGKVGLEQFTRRFPSQLSGGQQQRVGIARALANDPKVLLCDEPTSALDPELVHEVTDILQRLAFDGMTMLIVTHEMNFAKRVATACLFLDEGRIVERSAPKEFFAHPRSERLQQFLRALS